MQDRYRDTGTGHQSIRKRYQTLFGRDYIWADPALLFLVRRLRLAG